MNISLSWWIYAIISPIYFYISYIAASAFHINKIHEVLNRIVAITEVAILCVFFIYPIYLLIKKKAKKAIIFFSTQLLAFIICVKIFNIYDITMDKIDFKINEDNYKSLIKDATPFRAWGDKRLFLINVDSHYMNCTRYFVYDESHEFANPKNEFFGIGYVYATTQNGERFHSSNFDVRVKRYGDLTYIADVCP